MGQALFEMIKLRGDIWEEKLEKLKKEKLSEDKKKIIEKIDTVALSLLPIKKSKKKLKQGDVFVYTIDNKNYFYGKVLISSIKGGAVDFYEGEVIASFYKAHSSESEIDIKILSSYDTLISPRIVSTYFWNNGFFYTIGNQELTETEKKMTYGFWWDQTKSFVNPAGE